MELSNPNPRASISDHGCPPEGVPQARRAGTITNNLETVPGSLGTTRLALSTGY